MFKKIISECKSFIPIQNNLSIPSQQMLFSTFQRNNSHIKMGLFYEIMTASLFGGKLYDSIARERNNGKEDQPFPDVMEKKQNAIKIGESKACRMGHQLNLLDGQVKRYRIFQVMYPTAKIYYAIWRHDLYNIKKYNKEDKYLFEELANKTRAGIIVPFSIILYLNTIERDIRKKIAKNNNWKLKRYETDNWCWCTRISSTIWNKLLLEPSKTIKNLYLDSNDYIWEKYMTPDNLMINNQLVKPFPFIVIADKYHNRWVKNMLDEVPF